MLNLIGFSEGVIIKSVEPIYEKGKRIIYKHKNEKFSEVNPKPLQPTKHELERKKKKEIEEIFFQELERYINENRKIALESKIGIITKENLNIAIEKYVQDVLDDFQIDHSELWNDYPRKENVPKVFKSIVHSFFKKYLK